MKTHTIGFKNAIKQFGKEISSKITYTINNSQQILNNDNLNSISYHYNGDILKSVMKQLDIDSNIDIPLNTLVNFQFGVKVNGSYEYLNYGNFIVYKSEKQEDTNSYKLTCYDKLLYSMIDYETPKISGTAITYPITIRNYLSAICSHLGLTFANSSDTFTNYDKEIANELYLDNDGNSLGYTFRDVLDELAEVTGSIIHINNNGNLELNYLTITIPTNLINLPNATKTTAGGGTITTNEENLNIVGVIGVSSIWHNTTNEKIQQEISAGNYIFSIDQAQSNLHILIRFYNGDTKISSAIINKGDVSQTITLSQNITSYEILLMPLGTGTSFNTTIKFDLSLNNNLEVIDKEMFKDVNVNFSEQYGPINTVVFSRSGGADKIALSNPQNLSDSEKKSIIIEDNQILNGNDRSNYLQPLLNQLYGLNYYINDFSSTGIGYLELGDIYNVKIDNNTYQCLLLNDELNISQGLEENIYTDLSEQAEVEYGKTTNNDKTNVIAKKAYIIANKAEGTIEATVSAIGDSSGDITPASILLAINDDASSIKLLADKINLNGYTSINNNLVIDLNGFLHMYGGDIELEDTGEDSEPKIVIYDENSIGTSRVMLGEDLSGKTISFTWPSNVGGSTDTRVVNNGALLDNGSVTVISSSGGYSIIAENNQGTWYNESVTLSGPNLSVTLYSYSLTVIISLSSYQLPDDFGKITDINTYYGTPAYIYSPIQRKKITTFKSTGLDIWDKENDIMTEYKPYGLMIVKKGETNYFSTGGIRQRLEAFQSEEVTSFNVNSSSFQYITGHLSDSASSSIELTNNNGNHSSDVFSVYINGSLQIRANSSGAQCRSLGALSLASIKKNFERLDNGLDLVLKTDVYKYHLKEQEDIEKKHIGFVIGKNYKCANEIISNSKDSVDLYSGLAVAFKAIQDQQEIINDLIKRIEKLEGKNE